MNDPLATISTRRTPQSEQADPRQVVNSAGGYTFTVDDTERLRRFLTLGSTGGSYYSGERELTKDNAAIVLEFARNGTAELVELVVAISTAGRAPKQNPTLFALAAAAKLGDDAGRKAALAAVPAVVRTGTHLFIFTRYLEQFGGWGRGTRRAIGNWYADPERPVGDVAYQMAKYQQREGVSHRDLLRLAHPVTTEPARRTLFDWALAGKSAGDRSGAANPGRREVHGARHEARRQLDLSELPLLAALEEVQAATTAKQVAGIVARNRSLSWEMLPDQFINDREVWEALLTNGVPQTALMRQLPRLTRLGMLDPLASGSWATKVAAQLVDGERLKKARVHPINVLVAQRTYASGHSARGDSTWSPSRTIVDALDAAFYAAYGAIVPTGKRLLLALDVSGSMGSAISNMPLTCSEASAALALVTAATESAYEIVGFSDGTRSGGYYSRNQQVLTKLAISPRQRLEDAISTVSNLSFGGTDCALPMIYAERNKLEVDAFIVYTDNETWFGGIHPHQALASYRRASGIDARLVVVGMTSTGFTIADPSDPGMLDIAGFDSAVPSVISDFARGA
jgi:60 kDa SS-A/Ro ribonucleoprotein